MIINVRAYFPVLIGTGNICMFSLEKYLFRFSDNFLIRLFLLFSHREKHFIKLPEIQCIEKLLFSFFLKKKETFLKDL